jgi:hypothetical protein
MRLKLYYMPEEITSNLYTNGGEFQTEDGVEYRGSYHRYITNEIYTGATWNSKTSKKLMLLETVLVRDVVYSKLKTRLQTKFITPQPINRTPTITEYNSGYFERYFLKKCNEQIFIETDEIQHTLWRNGKIDQAMFNAVTFRWFISGNIDDVKTATTTQYGVLTKNKKQIQYAQQVLPGIVDVLTNPLQYYGDVTYNVPKDINT